MTEKTKTQLIFKTETKNQIELARADITKVIEGVDSSKLLDSDRFNEEAYHLFESLSESRNAQLEQFFTPVPIVKTILDKSGFEIENLKKMSVNELRELKVIDPACGYGIFLLEAIDRLVQTYVSKGINEKEAYEYASHSIHGADLDPWMVKIAKKLIETKIKMKGIIVDLSQNFTVGDSLIQEGRNRDDLLNKKYNFVFGNPPYGNGIEKKRKEYYMSTYRETIGGHPNLSTLFIHRATQLLKEGGILGFFVAAPYLTSTYNARLRRFLKERYRFIELVRFKDRKKVVPGILQEFSILILKNVKPTEDYPIKTTEVQDIDHIISNQFNQTTVSSKRVLYGVDRNYMFLVSGITEDYTLIEKITSDSTHLSDLVLKVSTGQIVNFRHPNKIYSDVTPEAYPLIDIHNIYPYFVDISTERKKALWFRPLKNDLKLAHIGNLVITKRLTSKEQRRRVIAGSIKLDKQIFLGNKTNVIKVNGKCAPEVIAALLNSMISDFYIRKFSSNTQVSSNELRTLPVKKFSEAAKEEIVRLIMETQLIQKERIRPGTDLDADERLRQIEIRLNDLFFDEYKLTDSERNRIRDECNGFFRLL